VIAVRCTETTEFGIAGETLLHMACILKRSEVAETLISLHVEHGVPLSLQYTRALKIVWREGYWIIQAEGEDGHRMVNVDVDVPAQGRSAGPVEIARLKAKSITDADGQYICWELRVDQGWQTCPTMTVKAFPKGASRLPRRFVEGAQRRCENDSHDINGLFEEDAGRRGEWKQVDVRTDVFLISPPHLPAHGSCNAGSQA